MEMDGVGATRIQSIMVACWTIVRTRYSLAVLVEQA